MQLNNSASSLLFFENSGRKKSWAMFSLFILQMMLLNCLHSSSCFECFDFAGKLVSSSQSEWGVMRRNIYITYTVCVWILISHYGKKYKKYFYLEAVHQPLIKKTCTIFNFWPTTVDIYGTREIEVHFTILFASKITLSSCEWKVMGSSTYISDGFGNQKNRISCSK